MDRFEGPRSGGPSTVGIIPQLEGSQMTKTARFWVFYKDDCVRISLRDGQKLSFGFGELTDEGNHSEGEDWERDGDTLILTGWYDSTDCDGRVTSSLTREGLVSEIPKGPPTSADPHSRFIYHALRKTDSEYRDFRAESAG
jgi:hypothetical protein